MIFKYFVNQVKNALNTRVKFVQSDHGGEFSSYVFKKFLNDKGIIQRFSTPYMLE